MVDENGVYVGSCEGVLESELWFIIFCFIYT